MRERPVTFTINTLPAAGAAEIIGLDCAKPLDGGTLATLRQVMRENPVIAIRDQTLTAQHQAAFSRQLGPLESQDRNTYCHPDDPDDLILSNDIRPDRTTVAIDHTSDFSPSESSHQ